MRTIDHINYIYTLTPTNHNERHIDIHQWQHSTIDYRDDDVVAWAMTSRTARTCCPVRPAHGWKPYVNISHSVTPYAQTSDADVNVM